MKYRQLRVRATGQWLDVLFIVDGSEFSVPAASHQADIARALGLAPDALEVVDTTNEDVRVFPMLAIPPPPPSQPTAEELAHAKAVSDAAAEVTNEIDRAFTARGLALTATERTAITSKQLNLINKAQGR